MRVNEDDRGWLTMGRRSVCIVFSVLRSSRHVQNEVMLVVLEAETAKQARKIVVRG